VLLGAAVAYVDSRPHWDDSGVTAAALFVVCLGFGAAAPRRPWLWALLVGTGVPLVGVLAAGNYGSLLALLFSFAGAYSGMAVRRTVAGATG
jgi:hypothetical protein